MWARTGHSFSRVAWNEPQPPVWRLSQFPRLGNGRSRRACASSRGRVDGRVDTGHYRVLSDGKPPLGNKTGIARRPVFHASSQQGGRTATWHPGSSETQPLWLNRAGGDSSARLCAPAGITIYFRWPGTADPRIRARQHILRSASAVADFERDAMNAKDMVEFCGGRSGWAPSASIRRRRRCARSRSTASGSIDIP